MFKCWVCHETFPTMYKHEHHKVPRSHGGPDTPDNLVSLCPGCHDALHNVAYRLLSSKNSSLGKISADVDMIYKDVESSKRCFELACLVRDSEISVREGLVPNTRQLYAVGTVLRSNAKLAMVARAKSLGISQEAYVRSLILSDLSRHAGLNGLDEEQATRRTIRGQRQKR